MKKSKSLIIGYGEVGKGLHKVLGDVFIYDLRLEKPKGDFDVLHIAFPYSQYFIRDVKKYQKEFKAKLTIIHSSVPVGTSRACNAVHSPIRGVHPFLDKGIRTFVKYFGGKNADKAALLFKDICPTQCVKRSEDTEALKLLDTTQYGWLIVLEKLIYQWCKDNKIDFDTVYTHANRSYNEGYVKLGRNEVVRPYLKHMKGKIGGHCVVQNAQILKGVLGDFITNFNNEL